MTFPTIHLNGTSAECLVDGYADAHRSIGAAMDSINKIEFNSRDYYVAGPEAWKAAREEHRKRLDTLKGVADELLEIAMNIQDQRSAREAMKARHA